MNKFRITVGNDRSGGVYWMLYIWDSSLDRAIGEGWSWIANEVAEDREAARRAAREFAEQYLWREANPEEELEEFEL